MVLGQVSDVSEIPLLAIFEMLCQVEKKKLWKKENVSPIFSKGKIVPKELQAGPLHFSSWKSDGVTDSGSHFQT